MNSMKPSLAYWLESCYNSPLGCRQPKARCDAEKGCCVDFERFTIQEIKDVREGEQLLKLSGPLTMTTLFGFRDTLQATTAPLVILDLADVPYVDSAAVGLLVTAYVSCVSRGRR